MSSAFSKATNDYVLNNKLAQLVIVIISLSYSCNTFSTDYQQKKPFNIPKQSAMLSLISFAEQADITLLFPANGLENVNTNALLGKYSITQALQLLINGSSLSMGLEASGEVSIFVDRAFLKQKALNRIKNETVSAEAKKIYKKEFFKTQKKNS
jgi:hypothetical protein